MRPDERRFWSSRRPRARSITGRSIYHSFHAGCGNSGKYRVPPDSGRQSMSPTPIVIADDHPLLRQGLKAMIESDSAFTVAAEASDGETALRLIEQLDPSIAVLDINMPKLDGLSVAREVQAQNRGTKIIFITVHNGEDLFREALKLGAKGY